MDSLQEMQNLQLMVDNDFMSKVEAIAQLRGVTIEEARGIHQQILKDKAEEMEMMLAVGLVVNDGDDDDDDNDNDEGGE